jgi:hypothetical protein|tara:strand:+ start:691 stop:909 length:219 start_codon:yes stop_codon:yes gene_type:complete
MTTNTFYKFKVLNKTTNETKYFFKFNDLKEYCGISRPQVYKIFNGAKPKIWCDKYDFESVRVPRFVTNPDIP